MINQPCRVGQAALRPRRPTNRWPVDSASFGRACLPFVIRHSSFAILSWWAVVASLLVPPYVAPAAADDASAVLEATAVRGGLVVHVGCGDGRLTAALRADDSYVVQGLDTANVAVARAHIRSLGLYGPVSADTFDGKRLPYADNLVNLVVAESLGNVATEEALRVLAPGGVLYTKRGDGWTKTVKPQPGDTDEWTHYLYDASGNAVSRDEIVGPPGRLQWSTGPRHTRSHEHIPSFYALVSSGGRIFYIADAAPVESIRRTPQWELVARDAYNGLLLWKRPVGEWFPHIVNWGHTPNQLQRKLVAVGDRVYVAAGLHAKLSAVDASTGNTIRTYDNTAGTEEVVVHQGTLLAITREVTGERIAELKKWADLVRRDKSPVDKRESAEPLVVRLRTTERNAQQRLLAINADSGRLLWKKGDAEIRGLKALSLRATGSRAFFQDGSKVVCLDLTTGVEHWSVSAPPLRTLHGDRLICAGDDTVTALSVGDGTKLWSQPATLIQLRDAFVAGGSLWLGGFKSWQGKSTGKRGPAWGPYFAAKYDLETGEKLLDVEPDNPGHHHRCYANKATDRYILGGRRGTEFIDLKTGDVLWNSWARGVCKYGVMPANGLLYTPPHACGCYVAAKLTGFNALAPRDGEEGEKGRREEEEMRLEHGPAFGSPARVPSPESRAPRPTDWATYRGNAARSGSIPASVPTALRQQWQADVGGRLSSLTVAAGKVFVASIDEHRVAALNADSGTTAWQFTAGARIDSPPTIHMGPVSDPSQRTDGLEIRPAVGTNGLETRPTTLCTFGSRDGRVYSLRAADGTVAWRLDAAGSRRRVVVDGQLESVGAVHGSVLVHDDVVSFTAGRSSYLDGGIDLVRVEPNTGKMLSRTSVYSPDPKTGRQPPQSAPSAMPGTRSDILAADEQHIYLRDMVFDPTGRRQNDGNPHLFTLTDYLDDTWAHRSYWIFGTKPSISTGCSGRDRSLVYGRLVVFSESTVFSYGRTSVDWSNHLQDGPYRLFAVGRGNGSVQWSRPLPIRVRAMVLADEVLFVAGPRAELMDRPEGPGEDVQSQLLAVSAKDGRELARYRLEGEPVFDGMAAAGGRLYLSMTDGSVVCFGKETSAE